MTFEYVGVHLLDNPFFLDNNYDYYVPSDLREDIRKGTFVTVPFGTSNRKRLALVTELRQEPLVPGIDCKPIFSLCSEKLSLSEELLSLCSFVKEQTLCTFGEAVRAMVPASVLSRLEEVYSYDTAFDENLKTLDPTTLLICDYIRKKGSVRFDLLKSKFGPAAEQSLKKLRECGAVSKSYEIKDTSEKNENYYSLNISEEEAASICGGTEKKYRLRSPIYPKIISILAESDALMSEKELIDASGASKQQIKALADKGIIKLSLKKIDRSTLDSYIGESKDIKLNGEQENALETLNALIDTGEPRAALLHGITGSGKTCVILKLIDRVLEDRKSAIVLLPEISLTPQTLGIFCSRYGSRVAVIHSALSAGERFDTYNKIKEGKADVVIGTRSAVFAPVQNLGLIVIDEEQEHTYKSDMNPKYHAKDIARYRCSYNGALMLLASATPSLDSYKKAVEGKYTLIKLTQRFGDAELPKVTVYDMRSEAQSGNLSPLGSLLCGKLVENQAKRGQSILFLNRRGYNNFISCRSCGEAIKCPVCSVSMTYHTIGRAYDTGEMRCHWCGRRMPLPAECPSCHSPHLVKMGYGTQRIEQELSSLLPDASILRMDTDTAGAKYAYEEMLGSFRRHEADVLVGTQMVTKGHDFPDVTLVGVLLADSSLYLDDYRANERTFAMITQVIGRAGRSGRHGEAVIQTNNPDHECIKLACAQDYESFYKSEIRLRKTLVFPPFCDIAMMTLSSSDEHELLRASGVLAAMLKELSEGDYKDVPLISFGPFEAPVYKVENKYRMRLISKCRLNKRSRALFSEILMRFSRAGAKGISLQIDFNPSNL
ncbi:MAG: primosomal protein N' [Clostridia bacterium]|nr:primosomal protein N' [Clostridia bacterium]